MSYFLYSIKNFDCNLKSQMHINLTVKVSFHLFHFCIIYMCCYCSSNVLTTYLMCDLYEQAFFWEEGGGGLATNNSAY